MAGDRVTTAVADPAQVFAQPQRAVWSVLSLCDAHILYDSTRQFAQFQSWRGRLRRYVQPHV